MDMDEIARRTREAVAATIRAERSARGWTRDDLAARSGIKAQTIGRYERDEREPGLRELTQLAAAFGLTLGGFAQLADARSRYATDDEVSDQRAGIA